MTSPGPPPPPEEATIARGGPPPPGAPPPGGPPTPGAALPGPQPNNTGKILLAVLGVAVLVVGALVIGMQLGGDDDDDAAPSETDEAEETEDTDDTEEDSEDTDDTDEPDDTEEDSEDTDDTDDTLGTADVPEAEDLAGDLVTMVLDGDCTDIWDHTTEDFQDENGSADDFCDGVEDALPEGDFEVADTSVHPGAIETAAGIEVNVEGDTDFAVTFQMLNEDGEWLAEDIFYPGSD